MVMYYDSWGDSAIPGRARFVEKKDYEVVLAKLAEAERDRDFLINAQIVGRDELQARAETAEARVAELKEENKKFKEALRTVIDACDQGRRFETGSGGQTIDAQLRRTVINGVRAYPIEEAREILLDNP